MFRSKLLLGGLLSATLSLAALPAFARCAVDAPTAAVHVALLVGQHDYYRDAPPEMALAVRRLFEGRRTAAKMLFRKVAKTPEAQWPNDLYARIILDAGWSAWMLDGCPPT